MCGSPSEEAASDKGWWCVASWKVMELVDSVAAVGEVQPQATLSVDSGMAEHADVPWLLLLHHSSAMEGMDLAVSSSS